MSEVVTRKSNVVVGWILMLAAALPVAAAEGPAAESQEAARQRGDAYARLMRAQFAARRGDSEAVSAEVKSAVALAPKSTELRVEGAELLLGAGRRSEGEDLARHVLEMDPEQVGAKRLLADLAASRAFSSENDTASRDEAIRLFDELARATSPGDPHVLRMLVQLRLQAGDVAGATATARRMVVERPGDLMATRTLAQLLLKDGKEADALEVMLAFVAEHPQEKDLLGFAEQLARSLEAWEVVARTLSARGPNAPTSPPIQRLEGEALLRVGRTEDGVKALEAALEGEPGHDRARFYLAKAYRQLGRLADAAALFAGLSRESPEHPGYPWLLAETREAQGDVAGALAAYEDTLRLFGTDEEQAPRRDAVRQNMILLDLRRDDAESARARVRELENQDAPEALEVRGRLAIELQDWSKAREIARALRDADRAGASARLEGEIAAQEGEWPRAAERFAEAIERLGPYARRPIAEIYRRHGRPEDGEALLREWIRREPEQADARYSLGAYLHDSGRHEAAEVELREALRLNPRHAAALNFLGYALAERSVRLEEALALIQRALAVDAWNGAFLDSLGWVYYRMGRYDDARVQLERAARELPKDPTVLEHLGDIYVRLDESSLAFDVWTRALDAGPGDPEALRSKIARLGAAPKGRASADASAPVQRLAPPPRPR